MTFNMINNQVQRGLDQSQQSVNIKLFLITFKCTSPLAKAQRAVRMQVNYQICEFCATSRKPVVRIEIKT